MKISKRTSCRVCDGVLRSVIDLGEQYVQGEFLKEGDPVPVDKVPTRLCRCQDCSLIQMEHTVSPQDLYSRYYYKSGVNLTMRQHLRGITKEASAMHLLRRPSACVLDIGCNDGTLLSHYPSNFVKFGVDPSSVTAREYAKELVSHIPFVVILELFPSPTFSYLMAGKKVDIITSIAMFYDLDDPVHFCNGIRDVLSPEGFWIFEVAYLPSMLANCSYDTICAEHLEYYSLASIESILSKSQLKAFRVAFNDINGGSIRVYATHAENQILDTQQDQYFLQQARDRELIMNLNDDAPYLFFQKRVERHRDDLMALLTSLKNKNKTIHVYGASTKGNTILQWCGIDNSVIDYAADRNEDKIGARTIGSNIPIISEPDSRAMKPDYYLVLPWHFRKEFVQREQDMLDQGTSFIFPLPEIQVLQCAHPCL